MIRRRRNNILFFLCFQAMAVAIICFGSLINFHQYKIWGKPLIPNFVGYKRDIEKYVKTASFSKLARDPQQFHRDSAGSDFDLPVEVLQDRCVSEGSGVLYDISQIAPVSHRISSSGLRGPPVS